MDTSAWGAWHAGVFVTIFAVTQALFNHFGINITTKLTDFSGYLIFVVAIALTLSMLIWARASICRGSSPGSTIPANLAALSCPSHGPRSWPC